MKKLLIILTILTTFQTVKAQFSLETGITGFIPKNKSLEDMIPGFTIFGRTFIAKQVISENDGISIGIPLSLANRTYTDDIGEVSSFIFSAPLVVDYNYGLGAGDKNEYSTAGGYIGLGLGYTKYKQKLTLTQSSYQENTNISTSGMYMHAGVRVYISDDIQLGVRVCYLKSFNTNNPSIYGINLNWYFILD